MKSFSTFSAAAARVSDRRTRRLTVGLVLVGAVLATPLSADGVVRPHPVRLVTEQKQRLDTFSPIVARVLTPPHPVKGSDHKTHLAYELLILNTTPVPVVVRRIEALDPSRSRSVLSRLRGPALAAVMGSITGAPGVRIGPASTGLVIMDVRLNRAVDVPRRLAHRLSVTASTPGFPAGPFLTGRSVVIRDRAVRVSAPLRGARWVDLNGCCADATDHRTAVQGVNGALHQAQRFAVDFVRLQPDGRLAVGPLDRLSSYPYYGTPVRSATAGTVVSTRDGLPDQVPFAPTNVTVETAAGNHVVVALGHGRFAMYAHLRPHSVRVSVGDHVDAGEVLGRLGNSGSSDLPHLHFQIMDAPSPLGSEGLPFTLRRFTSPGSVPPVDQIDPTQPVPVRPHLRGRFSNVMPLNLQVVSFPSAR